jgi:hypothetical protein
MKDYPYSCLEQEVSRAIALRDENRWSKLMQILPNFLDREGLAKYFPGSRTGSDVLTSYLLAIAHEAGWKIPEENQTRMTSGLRGFIEGRVVRYSSLPTADLSIRKLAALEALSRLGQAEAALLSSIVIEPNLWPTSACSTGGTSTKDFECFQIMKSSRADQILRCDSISKGFLHGVLQRKTDFYVWLMVSNDTNAVRLVLSALDSAAWGEGRTGWFGAH